MTFSDNIELDSLFNMFFSYQSHSSTGKRFKVMKTIAMQPEVKNILPAMAGSLIIQT